jgi:hypothetical protein
VFKEGVAFGGGFAKGVLCHDFGIARIVEGKLEGR